MKNKIIYLTNEGMAEFRSELKKLQANRHKIADELRIASVQGDLRENLSMQIAEEKYRYSEHRIAQLEKLLASAKPLIVRPGRTARLGCHVTLAAGDEVKTIQLVVPIEANPARARISIDSPLGKRLLKKHVNEVVTIGSDSQATTYKITKIA